jgi:molybdate ABC transporter permease protein
MRAGLSPLWISLETSITATALAFVLGVAAAAAMNRYRGRGRGVFDGILTLPLVLPPTVVGFFLLLLFGRRSAIGEMLERVGLSIAFSWPGTVIAAAVVAFPLMYRATLGAFEQVNPSLLDAARSLGASEWRTFRRVLFPLARPGVIAGTVLTFARALGEFGATLMLAGNIPGRTQTMPVAIFFAADGGDLRGALGWVGMTVALSLIAIAALNYVAPQSRTARVSRGGARALPTVRSAIVARQGGAGIQPAELLPQAPGAEDRASGRAPELVVDLRKHYPGFDLSVAFSTGPGPLGILGASGSGKSMTIRCIAGLTRPDAGRVVLNGRVLLDTHNKIDLPPAERRIGIVFQDYALFPHLTVEENIGFGLHGQTVQQRKERVLRWSKLLQIGSLVAAYPGQLSGGQRQRVALARALAMEPEALLLDEPLSALDAHLRRQMEEQLRQALESYRGVTVLVTHDRDEAFRFCRDLAVLSGGKVAAIGPKSEIFGHPRSLAVARLTGCKNFARIVRTGAEEVEVPEWSCILRVRGSIPERAEYLGIRAHDLRLLTHAVGENTFPCWLVQAIEAPFETTLYLRLHAPPGEGELAHVEAEISREQWAELSSQPQPWQLYIDPDRLLFLEN